MPYGMSTYRAKGDPFLGSIVKGIGKIAGAVLPGPVGAAVRGVTGIIGGRPSQPPAMPGIGRAMLPGPGLGRPSFAGAPRKRRRVNYANQKALRRSLRRVTGYARQQKAVRKAAQEFAREFGPKRQAPRRDLPRGHVHVR